MKYYLNPDQVNASMKARVAELGIATKKGKRLLKETMSEKNRSKYFNQIDGDRLKDMERTQAGAQLDMDEQFRNGEILTKDNEIIK